MPKLVPIVAVILFLFDAVIQGQATLALLTGLVLGVVFAGLAVWSLIRKDKGRAATRGLAAAVFLLLAVAAVGWLGLNVSLAQRRATTLIAACRQFHGRYGRFPDRLEELVPRFIPSIPRARLTLMWGEFRYSPHKEPPGDIRDVAELNFARTKGLVAPEGSEVHSLLYYTIPPFGRMMYFFEQDKWVKLD
jgi:hypothetical protein